MSVDEIDTIVLLRKRSLTDSGRKPILQQNYIISTFTGIYRQR